ncbi:hypothetical protein LA080_011812 [Diaporthe eres]|nr:hypothetical protein LA080_011812 [Diaporthe eres]
MPITRSHTAAFGRRILLHLPTEIHFLIYDYLDWDNDGEPIRVFRPKNRWLCCLDCLSRDLWVPDSTQWSPWKLTQVSKELRHYWRHYYFYRTKVYVCMAQLEDFVATFLRDDEYRTSDCRKGYPISSLGVSISPEITDKTSLHILFEAAAFFSDIYLKVLRSGSERLEKVVRQLVEFSRGKFVRELLPNAGRLKSLFLDKDFNLWLCPQPGYLSSFPALDPAVRDSLYQLWNSVHVRHIFLELFPSPVGKRLRRANSHHCDPRHPIWQNPPHRSFIHSIRRSDSCRDFIIQPFLFVLPEGHNLTEIGVNEQQLRRRVKVPVWLQLVAPEDDDFHIRIEGPYEYPYEHTDEDFSEDVDTVEENHHSDGGSDEGDDSCSHEGDEVIRDVAYCLEDGKIPLQDLLETEYAGFGIVL